MENKTLMENKRNRRKKADLDGNLLEAAKDMIKEVGFANTTVVGIASKANIQASVFYNRYNDLDDFFEKLVREYDYWLNDSIDIKEDLTPLENYERGMNNLIDALLENKIMQQLLIWELSSDNFITKRTSENRERNSLYLINYFLKNYKNKSVDFNTFTAILISGIYYLLLRKDVSTFTGIDFNTDDGIKLLKTTITNMTRKVFENKEDAKPDYYQKQRNAIRKLFENGVDINIIKKSYDISDNEIELMLGLNDNKNLEQEDSPNMQVIDVPKRKRGRPRKVK